MAKHATMLVKKIAWLLVVVGLGTFLIGIYQLNTPDQTVPLNHDAFSFSTTQLFAFEGLTTISLILIGLGSYLMGYQKEDPSSNHFTLDFTKKMESSGNASTKTRPS